jgi:hypothetical protein
MQLANAVYARRALLQWRHKSRSHRLIKRAHAQVDLIDNIQLHNIVRMLLSFVTLCVQPCYVLTDVHGPLTFYFVVNAATECCYNERETSQEAAVSMVL